MRALPAGLLVLGACAGIPSPPSRPDVQERAFRQEMEADLRLTFTSWEAIDAYPWYHLDSWRRDLSRAELLRFLREVPIGRFLCIVIFSKRVDLKVGMDEIESLLRGEGFRRVIFQQHVGKRVPEGRPILRE
jgi:hypothetical protein